MQLSVNDAEHVEWIPYAFTDLDESAQEVTLQDTRFGGYYFFNPSTSVVYVQVFNVAGSITVGTTPPTWVFGIPPKGGAHIEFKRGRNCENGIRIAATAQPTTNDAPAADIVGHVLYL